MIFRGPKDMYPHECMVPIRILLFTVLDVAATAGFLLARLGQAKKGTEAFDDVYKATRRASYWVSSMPLPVDDLWQHEEGPVCLRAGFWFMRIFKLLRERNHESPLHAKSELEDLLQSTPDDLDKEALAKDVAAATELSNEPEVCEYETRAQSESVN